MYCLGYVKKKENSQTCSSSERREICKAGHKGESSSCLQSSEPEALSLAGVFGSVVVYRLPSILEAYPYRRSD